MIKFKAKPYKVGRTSYAITIPKDFIDNQMIKTDRTLSLVVDVGDEIAKHQHNDGVDWSFINRRNIQSCVQDFMSGEASV